MKKIIILILTLGLSFCFANKAEAVKAYPYPITITQPDGSKLTIQVFGDEFLSWTTCGNSLVKKGKDGYYYYANFNSDGTITATTSKVRQGISRTYTTSPVTPPTSAVAKAQAMRREMNLGSQNRLSRNDLPSKAVSGNLRFLVLLIEFSDLQFTVSEPNTAFTNLLNQKGYSANGATGSAKDFYSDNSNNIFTPQFDVIGPVKVSKPYSYYSENKGYGTPGVRDLLVEACQLIDSKVDFSQYDNDGDGEIDNVFFYFAGYNMAEGADGTIWPHKWAVSGNNIFDGKKLYKYACTSEYKGASGNNMCGIGTFCHEFGHVIGLPDFYDTDYNENGKGYALGSFSLMSSGNYNNSGNTPPYFGWVEKYILGWQGEPQEMIESGKYSLQTVTSNKTYMTPTTNKGEFYIYENRQQTGWDKYLPGHGLLIYHIDQSDNMVNGMTAKKRWLNGDGINDIAAHQCCDLVEAVIEKDLQNSGQVPFPGTSGKTSFTSSTSPAAISWSGLPTGYDITNIAENGYEVTFNLTVDKSKHISGIVTDMMGRPVAGATVKWNALQATNIGGNLASLNKVSNGARQLESVVTDKNGKYSIDCGTATKISLETSYDGYNKNTTILDMTAKGYYVQNIILYDAAEALYENLKKYTGGYTTSIGYGKTDMTVYGAIGYEAEELTKHVGKKITTVSFMPMGTLAYDVKIIVYFGDNQVLARTVPNPKFGTMNIVDISDANLTIPANTAIKVGYSIRNSNSKYPIACANGNVAGSGYVSEDLGKTWENITEYNWSIMVSFNVYDANNTFYDYGYNVISGIKESYTEGEDLVLSIAEGKNKPTTIIWFFDNKEQTNGATIKLTKGEHTIKAILKYSDGSEENLVQEIQVQ